MRRTHHLIALRCLAACAAALAALTGFADAAKEKPLTMEQVVVQEVKTHTLFMGADISLNLDKDFYPVRDVEGGSWVVEINHQDRVISAKSAPINLRITQNLKLSELSATIEGYSGVRGYTFNNDPSVRLTKGLAASAMTNALLQGVAKDAENLQDTMSNTALGGAATLSQADKQFGEAGSLMSAPDTLHRTKENTRKAEAMAENGNELGGRLQITGVDAMEVNFGISSARPLRQPYIVTITKFHARGTPAGTVQSLVYAKSLNPIQKEKAHVEFTEGGFPFDFELIDFQVHLYDRGIEVPTTLSANRVEMTRGEAFEFVKTEYINKHKGATRPPVPAMGKLPAELPNKLATGNYGETFYVKVDKDGLAEASFADAGCTNKIEDSFLSSVVTSLRFKPALDHGKPVEGIAALNLSKLTI
jgi:hypothetical protein